MTNTREAGTPAVFFDRDGTLMEDVDYCGDPLDVHVFPAAADALRQLKSAGFRLFVITNQSGIGRGYFTEAEYRAVHEEFLRQLGASLIDAAYYCPHTPDQNCACRKPSPQMLLNAAREHRLDLSRSYFVGDKATDVECARNAGLRSVLVRTGYGNAADSAAADLVAGDLEAAAEAILRNAK